MTNNRFNMSDCQPKTFTFVREGEKKNPSLLTHRASDIQALDDFDRKWGIGLLIIAPLCVPLTLSCYVRFTLTEK